MSLFSATVPNCFLSAHAVLPTFRICNVVGEIATELHVSFVYAILGRAKFHVFHIPFMKTTTISFRIRLDQQRSVAVLRNECKNKSWKPRLLWGCRRLGAHRIHTRDYSFLPKHLYSACHHPSEQRLTYGQRTKRPAPLEDGHQMRRFAHMHARVYDCFIWR